MRNCIILYWVYSRAPSDDDDHDYDHDDDGVLGYDDGGPVREWLLGLRLPVSFSLFLLLY